MTNEEMIKDLSRIMDLLDMYIDLKQSLNITQMEFAHLRLQCIVKALEQQPCEDCVSREEAIRIAEQGQIQGFEWQLRKLCTLPSVTPQRPKGHWIPIHPLQEDDEGAYMCSCCRVGDWGIDPKVDKCCFNCGADMRGGEE